MEIEPKMELRVWEGSPLIGKTIAEIDKRFQVKVFKITRGEQARNPPQTIHIESGDYISIVGNKKQCLEVLSESASKQ